MEEGSSGGTSEGSPHHFPGPRATREEESQRRAGMKAEQPPSGSEAHQRQPSPSLVERHRLVSPSSAARRRQGSSRDRDTHDSSLDVAAEAERARRTLEVAQATTLRRKGRLRQMQRKIAAAESAEREDFDCGFSCLSGCVLLQFAFLRLTPARRADGTREGFDGGLSCHSAFFVSSSLATLAVRGRF